MDVSAGNVEESECVRQLKCKKRFLNDLLIIRRHDNQQNGTQHTDTQDYTIRHNEIQHYDAKNYDTQHCQ